jgi:lipopolysaccharide export system ATP-binding protein
MTRSWFAVAALGPALFAGCGSHAASDAGPSPSPPPPSPTPFVASPPPVNFHGERVGSRFVYATKQDGARKVYVLRADTVNAVYTGASTGRSNFTNPHVVFYGDAGKRLTADAPAGTVVEKDKTGAAHRAARVGEALRRADGRGRRERRRADGRGRRLARPQRRGQDDHVLHGRRSRAARRRPRRARIAGAEIDLTGSPMYERARAGIGYLAQENSIFRKLSVGDNIRLIWEMNGVDRKEQERRLAGPARRVRAAEVRRRARRFALGRRAPAGRDRARDRDRARLLLLDEPFTGIDPIAVADIQAMIRQLRDRGLGVLITDHQVRETLAIVDRAYILNDGQIVVSGTASEVLSSAVARQFYLGEGFRL